MASDSPIFPDQNLFPGGGDSELFDLGFIESDAVESSPDDCDDIAGDIIGRYRLVAPLGEGGFGFVWRAMQIEPIQRELALKLIKRGMDSREIIARFGAESRALAMMDHPNIAVVLDAGATPDGRPYFAMELVKGDPLTTYCDTRKLGLLERLELFIPVCQAVQHAHQKGILHRDLKPSNILMAVVDGRPVAKVIDFGIAKALGDGDDASTAGSLMHTRLGGIIGTPHYMSPEQAGSVKDVDTRSDIYSLGVLLHELITGQTPLARSGPETTYDETLRRVRTEESGRPSNSFLSPTAASIEAATNRGSDPAKLRRSIRGDLDWIVLKALEKDRRRRYETATALAADLARFLKKEPVSAVAPTWQYRMRKMVQRNRTVATAALVVSLTLVGATVISTRLASEAEKARALSEKSRVEAEHSRAEAEANAAKARKTVETYLTSVSDNPKLREESFKGLRRELLETALPFYEELAAKKSEDITLLADRAWILSKLGGLYRSINDRERALKTLQEAAGIEKKLVAFYPENPFYKHATVASGNNIAVVLDELGRHEEAVATQKHSIAVMEELIRRYPDNGDYPRDLTFNLVALGNSLAELDKVDESEAVMLRAIAVREDLARKPDSQQESMIAVGVAYGDFAKMLALKGRFPAAEPRFRKGLEILEDLGGKPDSSPESKRILADACYNFAFYLRGNGKSEEALALQKRSLGINRLFASRFPNDTGCRYAIALGIYSMGESLAVLGRTSESEDAYQNSREAFLSLASEFTENSDYFYMSGRCLGHIGKFRREAGDVDGASRTLRECVEMHRKAHNLSPSNAVYRSALGDALGELGESLIATRDAPGATAVALEMPRYSPQSWEQHEKAALIMAGTLSLLRHDSPEEYEADKTRAIDASLDFLKTSIDLGNLNMPGILRNDRFASLKGDARFVGMEERSGPDPNGSSPGNFKFDYPFSDPGPRIWKREGDLWTETAPSGTVKKFDVVRRIRLKGTSGTELLEAGGLKLSVFIPDLQTPGTKVLMIKQNAGEWGALATILEMN